MKKTYTGAVGALAVTAGLLGAGVSTAPAAVAAANTCTSSQSFNNPSDGTRYVLPHYKFANGNGTTHCIMRQGNNSSGTLVLQRALRKCYGRSIPPDGIFGPATEKALKYAQSQHGLVADGVYGPNTRDAIRWTNYNSSGTSFCRKI